MYVPNPLFEKRMSVDREYMDALFESARQVAVEVRAEAPVQTGDYRKSIRARRDMFNVTVGTDDFAGHIIEWGSINSPAQAPLRRGILAAGLRFDEASR